MQYVVRDNAVAITYLDIDGLVKRIDAGTLFVSADGTRPCQFLGGDGVREATGGFASGYRAVK
ncbi:hypothetical protein, partial [Novosphingobium arvoryzae]|uniref:hypothetical protein n=1 Tax=Novosphingobium arvoryzae TaxID=1256514 RepID=UPI001E3BF94B